MSSSEITVLRALYAAVVLVCVVRFMPDLLFGKDLGQGLGADRVETVGALIGRRKQAREPSKSQQEKLF